MTDRLRTRIGAAIRSMRMRALSARSSSPDRNPLMMVASILTEESRRRGAVNLSEAADLTELGIDALFTEAGGASPEQVDDCLRGMCMSTARLQPGEPTGGLELGLLLSVLATHRLVDAQLMDEEGASALYMTANGADDELVKRSGPAYFLRPAIVCELERGLSRMPEAVRHIDLVASLKWAIVALEYDGQGLYDVGLRVLRDLPERIARRIAETYDGEGPGPTPSGRPLDPRKVAGRVLYAPSGSFSVQRYRSLPRLDAEAHLELGRALAETRFGPSEDNLEEAHRRFDRAAIAYFAAGEPGRAATCAVLAIDCLDRLIDLSASDEIREARLGRLLSFGVAAQHQIQGSELTLDERARHAQVARSLSARALPWDELVRLRQALACQEQPKHASRAIVEQHFKTVNEQLQTAATARAEDPWRALAALSALVVEAVGFASGVALMVEAKHEAPEGAAAAFVAKQLDKVVDADVLSMFIDSITEAAHDLREPSRALSRPLARGLRRHPLASPRRLFEAVRDLLHLLGAAQKPLSQAEWDAVATILDPIGVPPALIASVLSFQRYEASALGCSLRGGVPSLSYLERRIRTIEEAMRAPALSAAERAVLSGWLSLLVGHFSAYIDRFRALPAEQALWFLDRCGAAAFRAGTLWFGRGEIDPPPFLGPLQESSLPEQPTRATATKAALAWTAFHVARDQLDLWGRFRVAEETRRVNPSVDAAFAADLARPTRSTVTLRNDLSDVDREEIERLTRVPRARWEETDSFVRIEIQPQSHEHICQLVDQARREVTAANRALLVLGEIDPHERLPDADPDRLRALLLGRPTRAIVAVETLLPVPVPLAAFFVHRGEIARRDVGTLEATSLQQAFATLWQLRVAIDQDRRDPGEATFGALGDAIAALESAFRRWSEELAAILAREGVREIVFLSHGMASAHVPWEDLPAGDGTRLGERFTTSHVHTLASLPDAGPTRRDGVVQVHGDGLSAELMRPAAAMMRSMAAAGIARPPLAGSEARRAPVFWEALGSAQRLRFFLHGYHHPTRPTADRLTLVDAAQVEQGVDLNPEIIRALPLRGLRCAELWACEGGAHGRHIMEHGVAEEPEDLTTAFLHAGAQRVLASRWHVPALPSALLMERFALLVDAGADEAAALSTARKELREAFARGGPIERAMAEQVARRLALRQEASTSDVDDLLALSFADALHELRAGWYAARELLPPARLPLHIGDLPRLVRFVPPRSERIANARDGVACDQIPGLANEYLRPLRNPACWAGWRQTLRSIDP